MISRIRDSERKLYLREFSLVICGAIYQFVVLRIFRPALQQLEPMGFYRLFIADSLLEMNCVEQKKGRNDGQKGADQGAGFAQFGRMRQGRKEPINRYNDNNARDVENQDPKTNDPERKKPGVFHGDSGEEA